MSEIEIAMCQPHTKASQSKQANNTANIQQKHSRTNLETASEASTERTAEPQQKAITHSQTDLETAGESTAERRAELQVELTPKPQPKLRPNEAQATAKRHYG